MVHNVIQALDAAEDSMAAVSAAGHSKVGGPCPKDSKGLEGHSNHLELGGMDLWENGMGMGMGVGMVMVMGIP